MAAKRGARPNPPVKPVGPVLDGELLAERQKQVAVMNEHTNAVLAKFGDGMPYVREHYLDDLRYQGRRNIDAMLTMGRRLVVMREMEPHGDWLNLLEQAGIDPRYAQRLMLAAQRIASLPNAGTYPHLERVIDSQSKFFALLTLPEEEFKKLAIEGEGGGVTLGDVEEMNVRDLKKALKDAQKARDSAQRAATEQAEQIAKLTKRLPQRTPDTDLRDMLRELGGLVRDVKEAAAALTEGVNAIVQHAADNEQEVSDDIGAHVTNAVRPIAGLLFDLSEMLGIKAPANFVLDQIGDRRG